MKADEGSTLPLIIGLSALLISMVLVTAEAQSLVLVKARALSEARLAALYIAKQTAGFAPVRGLDYSQAALSVLGPILSVRVASRDGKTFDAEVCQKWESPFGLHPAVAICDQAKARAIS